MNKYLRESVSFSVFFIFSLSVLFSSRAFAMPCGLTQIALTLPIFTTQPLFQTRIGTGFNRLTEVKVNNTTEQLFTYDKLSRMLSATDYNQGRGTNTVQFEYDALSRVTAEIQNGKRVEKTYDLNSNPTRITYPSGKVVDKTYNSLNLLDTVKYQNTQVAAYTYNLNGQQASLTYNNGISATFAYDNLNRETNRSYVNSSSAIVYSMATTYDKVGNIILETGTNTRNYFYDNLYRLTGSSGRVWQYDKADNWTYTDQNNTTYGEYLTTNSDNEYTQFQTYSGSPSGITPMAYDLDGNLASLAKYDWWGGGHYDPDKIYTYDWSNRLIGTWSNSNGIIAQYTYDALNRRVSKTFNSQLLTFNYDNDQLIEEYTNGSYQRSFVYGNYIDDVLVMDLNGTVYYYLKDRQYNVTALTDSTGTKAEWYYYTPFGKTSIVNNNGGYSTSPLGNPFSYTGRYYDSESSLYNYRNRIYSPYLGRFLQQK